ncbi:hypothetical protein OsccyDRAFT_0243 [Leptolyngbyaceae cyanobacterium JSC-12]|nr:hypothetical protein OsccyDRAFT_0243 [Leptolyngbyaceae cyanobacterium JSC-12]
MAIMKNEGLVFNQTVNFEAVANIDQSSEYDLAAQIGLVNGLS